MLKLNILKFYCIFFAVFLHSNSFTQCQSGDCEDGYGLYTMTWGDRYQGGWKNGVMHGQGTYQFANGDKYIGTFKNGLRDGQGVYVRINGNELIGLWEKNQFLGEEIKNKMYCESGNCANGDGISKSEKGDSYEGSFLNGKYHGKGVFVAQNG